MTTTKPSERPWSKGARVAHVARFRAMKAARLARQSHEYSPTEEGDIPLADSGSDTESTAELREHLDGKLDQMAAELNAGVTRMNETATQLGETVEGLRSIRFQLDQEAITQLGAALQQEFARISQTLIEDQTRKVTEGVAGALGGKFFDRTRQAIAETAPGDSPLGRVAKVCAIGSGVLIAGMVGTYAYAVMNYKPPTTTVEVDAASGEASVSAAGGAAL